MWLQFGVDGGDRLVPIEDVRRGKTDLMCPYCGGLLTAKKGKVLAHHFAHTGETCRQTGSDRDLPTLPCYDRFDLHLGGKAWAELKELWESHGREGKGFSQPATRAELLAVGCVKFNEWRRYESWEFTKLGKLAVGGLSLMLFCQEQETLMLKRLERLEKAVIKAKQKGSKAGLADALVDLRIYRAQYRRVLERSLYFLEVQADGEKFYKIGVTARAIDERIPEIKADLANHFTQIEVKPLVVWERRGSVEFYFKYRYESYQKPIGRLTEYFDFGDEIKSVLRDLRRMKAKELSAIEQGVLTDDFSKVKRSLLTKAGMAKAKNVGRPADKEYQVLLRYPKVVAALESGLSLRKVAKETGVAINTVRKVKYAMEIY